MKHRKGIDLGTDGAVVITLGRMRDAGYRVDGYCEDCQRHKVIDLTRLCQSLGEGFRGPLGGRLSCDRCGSRRTSVSIGGPTRGTDATPAR